MTSKLESAAIDGGFLNRYYDIKAAGRSQEQAFYAAWFATPRQKRIPPTAAELAALLGYTSTRIFSHWRADSWWRELAIEKLRERVFEEYLAEVDEMTIKAATEESGPAGVAARKLFYEQLRLGTKAPGSSENEPFILRVVYGERTNNPSTQAAPAPD